MLTSTFAGTPRRHDRRHLKRKFGLTPEQYDEMLAAQGGTWTICRRPPRPDISLHVDHDHTTGAVRGLLCFRCNNALGDLGDELEHLRRAVRYVLHHDPEAVELAAVARERLTALRS